MPSIEIFENKVVAEWDLFDDEFVRKKITIMDKWEAMTDDARNATSPELAEAIELLLKLGRRYRVTIEEIGQLEVLP